MFKGLCIGFLLGVSSVLGGLFFYFASGRAPAAVTDPPMPFEKRLAKAALNAHLEREGGHEPPLAADEPNLLAGAAIYRQNCAVCHGVPGGGPSTIAAGLYPKPPQLFEGKGVTDDPVWETHWKAANGIRLTGMPGFGGKLTDAQLWQVSQLLAQADKIPDSARKALLTVNP